MCTGNGYFRLGPAVNRENWFLPHRRRNRIARGCQGMWDQSLFRQFSNFLLSEDCLLLKKRKRMPPESISILPWVECKKRLQKLVLSISGDTLHYALAMWWVFKIMHTSLQGSRSLEICSSHRTSEVWVSSNSSLCLEHGDVGRTFWLDQTY